MTLKKDIKKKRDRKKEKKYPYSLEDSIPYLQVYTNGIFELKEGVFSKTYKHFTPNFLKSTNEIQKQLAIAWGDFLGRFPPDVIVEETLYNRTIDMNTFQEDILIEMRSDNLNEYRSEYNEMLLSKMSNSKNNLYTERYLSVSFKAKSIMDANERFHQIDEMVIDDLTQMTRLPVISLSTEERLDLLYSIYHLETEAPLYRKEERNGKVIESFSLQNCIKQGISTKEVVAPEVIKIFSRSLNFGRMYSRTFHIVNYPTWIKGDFMTSFLDVPCNMIVSVYYDRMDQVEAARMIKNKGVDISSEVIRRQQNASKSGYDVNLISPDLQDANREKNQLLQNLTKDDERIFKTSFYVTIFAHSKEMLDQYEKQVVSNANKHMASLRCLTSQQERSFNTSLPLAYHESYLQDRIMTTNTVSVIIPFDTKDLQQRNGIYYGQNAVSKRMILADRTLSMNPNACILGMPGAGKSFLAKREIIYVLLNTTDEIYILDPEGEYVRFVEALGGTVIKMANGTKNYINPFDMHLKNADDDGDPVKVKTDFIETVCEVAIGGKYGLSPIEKSIINRCVLEIYEPYVLKLKENGEDIDTNLAPTMHDFYLKLLEQPQPEAQSLAISLERYVNGSMDLFSHKTNIKTENRLVVYDILELGSGLMELGLQICLDNIWNKMISNHEKGKRTWIYADEFSYLIKRPTAAAYLPQIWKRARKWSGVPTAITQMVEDVLGSPEGRTIIATSPLVIMLSQLPGNREQLCRMFGISREEEKFISLGKEGEGLIRVNEDIYPMVDHFPKDTKLYKLMTSKPNESSR